MDRCSFRRSIEEKERVGGGVISGGMSEPLVSTYYHCTLPDDLLPPWRAGLPAGRPKASDLMQRQSYQIKTVLEKKGARKKTFLAFKDSLGNPLSRSP